MLRELGSRTISRSKPGGALSPGQPECVEECVVRVRYGEALCDIEQPSGAEDPADGVGWKPRGDEGTHSLERQRQYPRQHSEARVGPLTGLEFEGLTELTKSSKRASPMSTTQATHNDQASQAAARRFEPPLFRPWLLALSSQPPVYRSGPFGARSRRQRVLQATWRVSLSAAAASASRR
jgi:hypothetical protein